MKQYLKLLMAREGKDVLGKRGSNLWLLTIVLVATFASIAFSEGSMIYLKDKMEDPFTNWVSIQKNNTDNNSFSSFREALGDTANMAHYKYSGVQMDQYTNYTFQGNDEHNQHYLACRFFEQMNTPLVKAILSEDNVIPGCEVDTTLLTEKTMGFIMTLDVAKRLGYSESNLPTYINYLAYGVGADSIGVKMVADEFVPVALPVLGVVRRLPDNVDMVSANWFYEQQHLNDEKPFDFCSHEQYQHQLEYYVADGNKDKLAEAIKSLLPDSLKSTFQALDDPSMSAMKCWKKGGMVKYELSKDSLPRELFQNIAAQIEKKFDGKDVHRVFQLDTKEQNAVRGEFISVNFESLDSIRAFEHFAKDNYGIQLEMSQVASKENFNAVTVMARILSATMVLFSIACIIMFLVNMLQSYFQRVKRNIGTFKAFGMHTLELIYVYVIILIMIVCSAVLMALFATWLIQLLLPLCGVEKDGFNYLSLWNPTTLVAALVVICSTVITVCAVMIRMLSRTPGDLVYDRN